MALPSTGSLSASQINTELGRANRTTVDLNGTSERSLAGVTTNKSRIGFTDFRGKSLVVPSYLDTSINGLTFDYSGSDLQYGVSLTDAFNFVINSDGTFTKPQYDVKPSSWILGGANSTKANNYKITVSAPTVFSNFVSNGEFNYSPKSLTTVSTIPITMNLTNDVYYAPGNVHSRVMWSVTIQHKTNSSDKISFNVDLELYSEVQ